MPKKKITEIADFIQGKIQGDAGLTIDGITNIENPFKGHITFVASASQVALLEKTEIACIIAPLDAKSTVKTLILTDKPKLAWARLLTVFHPSRQYPRGISDKAFISPSAVVDPDVTIEPFVFVGERSKIAKGCTLRAGAYVDSDVTVGENTVLHPNVMLYDRTIIGKNVIIHAGSVIGSDGFGYIATGQENLKVPQLGNVVIEDDVEIGSNVSIDRATMGSTRIGKGVKLDNLVQIAHNVEFGENAVASSQVGVSGSSKIGKNVILAGQVGIADHCEVGDGAILGAQAGLPTKKKIPGGQIFFGSPARPYDVEKKLLAAQTFLAETIKTVRELSAKVQALEKKSSENLDPR